MRIKVKGREPSHDWQNFNWERTNKEIVEETGLTTESISRLRREFASKTVYKYTSKKTREVDWKSVDWNKKTCDLVEELRLAQSFISQKRRQFAPETLKKRVFLNLNK